jgi:hypothetical protein
MNKKISNNIINELPGCTNANFENANQAYLYHKYLMSILKKCIKLSSFCNLEVFLTVVDHNQNYTFFSSSLLPQEFIRKYLGAVGHKKTFRVYSNQDVC